MPSPRKPRCPNKRWLKEDEVMYIRACREELRRERLERDKREIASRHAKAAYDDSIRKYNALFMELYKARRARKAALADMKAARASHKSQRKKVAKLMETHTFTALAAYTGINDEARVRKLTNAKYYKWVRIPGDVSQTGETT